MVQEKYRIAKAEEIESYLSKASVWLASILFGDRLEDGTNLQETLSEEEQNELKKYIEDLYIPYATRIISSASHSYYFPLESRDDFIQYALIGSVNNLYRYNNPTYMGEDEKPGRLSTFLKSYIKNALRRNECDLKNVKRDALGDIKLLDKTINNLCDELEISPELITDEQIMSALHNKWSMQKLENVMARKAYSSPVRLDDLVTEPFTETEPLLIEYYDQKVQNRLYLWYISLTESEKFVFLVNNDFAGEYSKSTGYRIGKLKIFVRLCDEDASKHKYYQVGEVDPAHINYLKRKTDSSFAKYCKVYSLGRNELQGNLTIFLDRMWDKFKKEYKL